MIIWSAKMMAFEELREQIAKTLFSQTTMEHDWESRRDWVKDQYRKDADEIFDIIEKSGRVLNPKAQNLPSS
jgi:hypothetical protein